MFGMSEVNIESAPCGSIVSNHDPIHMISSLHSFRLSKYTRDYLPHRLGWWWTHCWSTRRDEYRSFFRRACWMPSSCSGQQTRPSWRTERSCIDRQTRIEQPTIKAVVHSSLLRYCWRGDVRRARLAHSGYQKAWLISSDRAGSWLFLCIIRYRVLFVSIIIRVHTRSVA